MDCRRNTHDYYSNTSEAYSNKLFDFSNYPNGHSSVRESEPNYATPKTYNNYSNNRDCRNPECERKLLLRTLRMERRILGVAVNTMIETIDDIICHMDEMKGSSPSANVGTASHSHEVCTIKPENK